MTTPITCLLGPQRFDPNVAAVLSDHRLAGRVAVVTAGWQERETEDQELRDHLPLPVKNLELYRRAEEVFRADEDLSRLMRERQEQLRRLQKYYRIRLEYLLECARDLFGREDDAAILAPEKEDAVDSVRRLDQHHLARVRQVHGEFEDRHSPHLRPAVARHREQLGAILAESDLVMIAGGHAAVLLNRLRLFGLDGMVRHLPVLAWSAGAMVLSEQVVLFHDSPPQGAGNAEILDAGLARCRGIVPLPRASTRLRLNDPVRVSILAGRFRDQACIALDPGSRVTFSDGRRLAGQGTRRLHPDGTVRQMESL
ncbi:MAG: Type 1 glutamine amidotransferase-like domain-containing protein [Acidobacteria bacterium]|uniref:Type 1 glutamine amidotransferase-like domain-containing protein n=1 Tax=Candidatus Polarisedimenticola svalbardensis TaxID=2886004 RepID=A0A8J6XXU5_9BACT|nr:Type 1 glutamine amidotransferase-like domain-containing protein [Candidatus Polarisedimenticola svalbardensis]